MVDLRVAILPYMASGGLSTYAIELSEALAARGMDVTLLGVNVTRKKIQHRVLPHLKTIKNIRDPFLRNATIGANATNIIKRYPVDIVHCVYPAIVPFIRLREPIVCSGWFNPHNLHARLAIGIRMLPFSLLRLGALWGNIEYFFLDDLGYRSSRRIFAITKLVEENLRRRFGTKVRYLPPGITLASGARKTSDQRVRVACIASNLEDQRKGVSILLSALALLEPNLREKVEIWLMGNYSKRLESDVEVLKRKGFADIRLPGYVQRERILDNLLQIDILVCPSMFEELGYVVLEAIGTGVPVIASRIKPLNDIISHGVSGLLFEKGNIRELSSMISMLVLKKDIRLRMGEEARKRALEEFGWNSIAMKLESHYKKVLENS